jgi:hypothetical protein
MRNILALTLCLLLISCTGQLLAQSESGPKEVKMDTLITKKNEKIIGKITRVSETEIDYKKVYEPDAPVYVISKDKLREIRWGNGTKELIRAEEMAVNQEAEILDKRSAIKFHFFSPLGNQLTFSYEHSLKVGTNVEISAGIINNSIMNSNSPFLIQGGLVTAGVKFLLGQDFYVNGMKYVHPLKGRFIKPEIDFSSFIVRGVQVYNYNAGYNYNGPATVVTDQKINSGAIMLNYGRQFILGNVITLSYSIGMGYAFTSSKYTDPSITVSPSNSSLFTTGSSNYFAGDMYSHYTLGLSSQFAVKGNLTIGYIFK